MKVSHDRWVRAAATASILVPATWAAGCGIEEPSEFDDGLGESFPDAGAPGEGFGDGVPRDGSVDGKAGGDGGLENDGAACATDTLDAERKPVRLVVALDQSGSMGLVPYGDKALKWTPVTTALAGFLDDQLSRGIGASLQLFPAVADDPTVNCSAASYVTPEVAMTALPNAAAFTAKLPATPSGLQTPTRAILKAMVARAVAEKAQNPNAAVAIVLITDGDPIGCGAENDISLVAGEATAGLALGVPTYVIGVGNLPNLNTIAQAGGTTQAFAVEVQNPQATQAQFLSAMNAVRSAQLSCEMTFPQAPTGKELAVAWASLDYSPASGATSHPPYDPQCANGGFKFDSPAAPRKVILCPALCDALKADPLAKVTLQVPCAAPAGPRKPETPR